MPIKSLEKIISTFIFKFHILNSDLFNLRHESAYKDRTVRRESENLF